MLNDCDEKLAKPGDDPVFRSALKCFGLMRRVMHPYFERHGISASQWGVLRALHRSAMNGEQTMRLSDLVERLLVRPPSVTGVVSRLEKIGLLRRSVGAQDQRVRQVKLTPKGLDLVEEILKGHGRQVQRIMAGLEKQEQAKLSDLLGRWSAHMESLAIEEESKGKL